MTAGSPREVSMALRAVRDAGARAVHAVERQRWLDVPSYKLEHGLALTFTLLGAAGERVEDFLHGVWLGHPLHSVLTDFPIGAWTVAVTLDSLDERRSPVLRDAARRAVAVGVVSGAAAAAAGLTDWQYTQDNARRAGLVHGALNASALTLNAWSWVDRGRGSDRRARAATAAGFVLVLASSYLGGELVFRHRIGVDHSDPDPDPRDFVSVVAESELVEDVPRRVAWHDATAVLVKHRGRVYGVGERCSHLGGPLGEAWVLDDTLICPWHGSRFDLATGSCVHGPATAPVGRFETRIRMGRVEIRRLPEVPAQGSVATPGRTSR